MATDRSRWGGDLPVHLRKFLTLNSSILIIDDDLDFRETFRDALELAGFDVIAAEDGETALVALEQHGVSLVITDMLMPGMDGIDVIHAIRQRNPGLKVIAISGGNANSRGVPSLAMASQIGADRVLKKPFGARDLIDMVRELLEAPPPLAGA
jgi:two-component system response regulator FlrC